MANDETWGSAKFAVQNEGKPPFIIAVAGRRRWALEALIAAGPTGCTPIDQPGPRWSGYVHELKKMRLSLRKITETHGGPFAGHHARYVLLSAVSPIDGATS